MIVSLNVSSTLLVLFFALIESVLFPGITFAQNISVSGYLLNKSSREVIPSGKISIDSFSALQSNTFGYFSLFVSKGSHSLTVEAPGFLAFSTTLVITRDTTIWLELSPWEVQLDEVRVTRPLSNERGNYRLTAEQINNVPTVLSEPDVLKVLQLLPGVQGGAEGTAGIHVRGGSPDQTLILMDGVPVYNANHLFGFFSVFNPDAVASVDLYKNDLPARYGGRLSSVVDITMREGNRQEAKQSFQLGPLSSKLLLEGPLKKGKSSYLLSVRRTWLNVLAGAAQKLAGANYASIGFYDFNAKINFQPNQKNRFFLSFYSGNDAFKNGSSLGDDRSLYRFQWGNLTGIARWNHVFGSKLFKNSTLSYTNYRFEISNRFQAADLNYLFRTSSRIADVSYKSDFSYALAKSELQFGLETTLHRFAPEIVQAKGNIEFFHHSAISPTFVADASLYTDYAYRPTNALRLQGGLRYNVLRVNGQTYNNLQPRLSFNHDFSFLSAGFRASYMQNVRYLHLLNNSSLGLPTDLWVPITDRIPPERAQQYALGFYGKLGKQFDWSLDVYTKSMRNLLEYTEGASFLGNSDLRWYDRVTVGKGSSKGVEVLLQKQGQKFSGFVSYTLSRTTRTFDLLNEGQTFPYRFDRRHVVNLSAQYTISRGRSLQMLFAANSGGYVTVATQRIAGAELPLFLPGGLAPGNLNELEVFPFRNNLQMPLYHRLDLSYKMDKQKRKGMRTWTFSVYNAYNNRNAFYLFVHDNRLKKFILFPVLPSVSYAFRFD